MVPFFQGTFAKKQQGSQLGTLVNPPEAQAACRWWRHTTPQPTAATEIGGLSVRIRFVPMASSIGIHPFILRSLWDEEVETFFWASILFQDEPRLLVHQSCCCLILSYEWLLSQNTIYQPTWTGTNNKSISSCRIKHASGTQAYELIWAPKCYDTTKHFGHLSLNVVGEILNHLVIFSCSLVIPCATVVVKHNVINRSFYPARYLNRTHW